MRGLGTRQQAQNVLEPESRMPGVPCKPSVDCEFAEWLAAPQSTVRGESE